MLRFFQGVSVWKIGIWRRVAADNALRTLAVILHPLGPSTISCYEKTEFGAFLPPFLREVEKIFDF